MTVMRRVRRVRERDLQRTGLAHAVRLDRRRMAKARGDDAALAGLASDLWRVHIRTAAVRCNAVIYRQVESTDECRIGRERGA
jgi:hypothetical protein